jgi:group II intron reverse transcriptase/maturase
MQTTEHLLQAMRKMGDKRTPLTRVYRCLYSEDLFLHAYSKIARNRGALTTGTENDTADGTSLHRIRRLIEQLRYERFRFHPARRIHIPKKSGGTRPLGIPNFSDKLVQEVVRQMLEAYYEPRFRESSHGFRPKHGCHTALVSLQRKFKGAVWFIEGDIRGCFEHIDHEVLMNILTRDIHDGRLLNLIRMMLEAGYLEDWRYHRSFSGTPQGATLSPLLANIYLNELDTFIEDELVPRYTRGQKRRINPDYQTLGSAIAWARQVGNVERLKQLLKQRRQLPSQDVHDPNFRRLQYIRYADDFILSFIGPESEAEEIKAAIGTFLKDKLHLEMSGSKTLITHARTQTARFLGYSISLYHSNTKVTTRKGTRTKVRSVNSTIRLGIPYGKVNEWIRQYLRNGKPIHEGGLLAFSDAQIVDIYQRRFLGLAEYYKYANDRCRLSQLKYVMEVALTKTLACKHKTSVSAVYRQYGSKRTISGYVYKVLHVEVPTRNGSRHIYWGGVPLNVVKFGYKPIVDDRGPFTFPVSSRTDLVQRLQANECEICGSHENCEVHHIHKLADLKHRRRGRKEKPAWVVKMIALRRKTLVVCAQCHKVIHSGKPLPINRTRILESRMT